MRFGGPAAATILLVEDDPDVAQMLSLGLSFAGHDVEVAGDGMRAVDRRARSNSIWSFSTCSCHESMG